MKDDIEYVFNYFNVDRILRVYRDQAYWIIYPSASCPVMHDEIHLLAYLMPYMDLPGRRGLFNRNTNPLIGVL